MKVSYRWLQTYFKEPLPPVHELEALLTFHSCEIDEVITVGDDFVLDVKVLPDKSAWLLSHRGVAKEIATIIGIQLIADPLRQSITEFPTLVNLQIKVNSTTCDYYSAALIDGVRVGPSPEWLKDSLTAIGQRSINNVVDATNYVMFGLGQPLHAFDAAKLGQSPEGGYAITVRNAKEGETITVLTGETYTLLPHETLIIDATTDTAITAVQSCAVINNCCH